MPLTVGTRAKPYLKKNICSRGHFSDLTCESGRPHFNELKYESKKFFLKVLTTGEKYDIIIIEREKKRGKQND